MSRIIEYDEVSSVGSDDYFLLDSSSDGTRKIKASLLEDADEIGKVRDDVILDETTLLQVPLSIAMFKAYSYWTFGSGIAQTTGATYSNQPAYCRSTWVAITEPILVTMANPDYEWCVWGYSNKASAAGTYSPSPVYSDRPVIIRPIKGTTYFRLSVRRKDLATLTTLYSDQTSDAYKILTSLKTLVLTDDTLSVAGVPADAKVVGDAYKKMGSVNSLVMVEQTADIPQTTDSGITYSCTDGVFSVSGTAVSAFFVNLYRNTSVLPDGMVAGGTYFIDFEPSQDSDLHVRILDQTDATILTDKKSGYFTLPSNITGMTVRMFVRTGGTVPGTVTVHPRILTAPSNALIYDKAAETEKVQINAGVKDAVNLIPDIPNGTTTKNGVTFTAYNGTITASGTASASTYYILAGSSTSVPEGVREGLRYFLNSAISGTGVKVRITSYDASSYTRLWDSDFPETAILIPSGTIGFEIALFVVSGATANATANVTFARALSNYKLSNLVVPMNPGAMLTIIDDDGAKGFLTDLVPLIESKHVPIASAIIGSRMGSSDRWMTWDDVQEAYLRGAEILNHTWMHYGESDETRTANEIRMDYIKNAHKLNSLGIHTSEILVFPGGSGNLDTCRLAAKRFANAAFIASGNSINKINSINPFRINRYKIESDYDYNIDSMKALIDTCHDTGGWMVWMIHTSASVWNASVLNTLSTAIDYAISSGVPIVTAEYGIKKYIEKRTY